MKQVTANPKQGKRYTSSQEPPRGDWALRDPMALPSRKHRLAMLSGADKAIDRQKQAMLNMGEALRNL